MRIGQDDQGLVRFLLLGPVRGEVSGQPVGLGTRQQRLVAAVLALEVNRLVTTDRLVDVLWPAGPPASGRATVHGHVSLLRRVLRGVEAGADGVRIDSAGAGYVLCCGADRIDAHRFRGLLSQARTVRDDQRRVALLDEALALWRGPAMAGTATEDVRIALCRDLEEGRLAAHEDRAEAMLRLGRHQGLAEELGALASQHPDRQRLISALMRALHRTGRTVRALEEYQRAVGHLRDELGLDPPVELRDLHVSILRADPDPVPAVSNEPG
jgi:ABC-2 type transport system ATP-binding protein